MSSYTTRPTPGDTAWFTADRFGMFIHFGLYSMAARHEWIKSYECIPEEKYDLYFKHFNPARFDARSWAKQAKAAGMKYAILTTKHHEGFCLFDSQYTDYKITNTPFGRDLVKEYVEAFRAEGLKVGFYYSLVDWHHPEFPIDWIHPRHNDPDAKEQSDRRDMKIYAQYMRDQVTELLTNYGKIDILWFDFSYDVPPVNCDYDPNRTSQAWMRGKNKNDWESEKLLALVRSLQPDIIVNNRTGIDQDVWTPEQSVPEDWVRHKETGERLVWEVCHTFSGSWGYYRDELTWKSPKMLIDLLINTVSCGGNLLMNVGPTANGTFDARAEDALAVFADWMDKNSRSIYNCTMAEPEFTAPRDCRLTQTTDGSRLYVHLMNSPFGSVTLKGCAGKVEYAQFLHDGSELLFKEKDGDLRIALPHVKPDVLVPVIELMLCQM